MKQRGLTRIHRAVAAGATIVAFAFTGCSTSGTSSSVNAGDGLNEQATLSYTIWDAAQKPAMQKIVDEFTKIHPNITINIDVVGTKDYWTKMQTAVSAGSGPDVFWMNGPNFALYASNGTLAPLDSSLVDTSNYPKALVDLYSLDGKLYGAPKDFDTIGVFYNKRLFQEAGVPLPTAGWTWDDFKADVAKLTNKSAGVYGIASAPYGQMTFYNTIYQAGGEVINAAHDQIGYGSPQAAEGVGIWADFIKNGQSPTIQQMTDTWPGDSFGSGKVAMFWDGSWGAAGYAKSAEGKNIDVAPLPMGPHGNQSVIHGLANVANAQSKHLAAAKAFAAFASGKEAADIMAATGTVIPAFNGTQEAWVKAIPGMNLQIFLDEATSAIPYPISKNTSAWNAIESDIIPQILSGKVSVEAGLADLAAKAQAELDKEK